MRYGSIVLGVIAILALLAPAVVLSDDSSAAACDDIKVYIEEADGSYEMSVVSGVTTVKGLIEAAVADQGKTIEYNSKGNVRSVDGLLGDDDHSWRVHQWLPLGTSGWGLMAFNGVSDMMVISGATYCLHLSTMSSQDGTIVYSAPDFKPEADGYVFIRFANGFSPDTPEVQEAFTADVRKEGFWLKGHGATMAEVLKDAIDSNGFQIELTYGTDSNGNELQGWVTDMFGLGDVLLGDDTWSYWSQWTWVDHEWYYNDWTLGFYDPAVYKYVECIYLISTPDPYAEGFVIDKGGPEPNPDVDEIVCISSNPVVTFKLEDGTVVDTQYLSYGDRITSVPEAPEQAGKIFVGWGDVTAPIVSDTTFIAEYKAVATYMVRYYDESKIVALYAESVPSGSASVYKGTTPYKAPTEGYTYEFIGWSADTSNVTSDMDVTAVFKAIPTTHDHVWDEGKVTKQPTCKETGIKTYTCTTCGDTRTESIPTTDHVWSSWKVVKEATADQAGQEERTCSVCGEVETREIPATGGSLDVTMITMTVSAIILGLVLFVFGLYMVRKKQ
ncbi:MAG: hypothetical protein E7Z68_00990 [Thermoplasmata archaeon]|nr:hypothetical protein [Thermoplasmata archaeon]